jgi:hypothetical protein
LLGAKAHGQPTCEKCERSRSSVSLHEGLSL